MSMETTTTSGAALYLPTKRSKSPVWEYFGFPKDAKGEIQDDGSPICRACGKKVAVKDSNTSDLYQHLRDHHADVDAQLKPIIADEDESDVSEVPEIVHCVGEEDEDDSDDVSDDVSGDPDDKISDDDWEPGNKVRLFKAVQTVSVKESSDDDDDDDGGGDDVDDGGGDDDVVPKFSTLCPDCGKLCFGRKKHTCEHKKKPYSCIQCGKRFHSEGGVRKHGRIHNDKYEYHCKYCFVKYKTKADKLSHEKSHVTEKLPFRCHECSEKFATYKEQTAHIRKHRVVKCHICGFEFTGHNSLKRHIAVHTGERPFTCVVCKRGFKQMSHLNSHLRTHTGEKPFACQLCDKRFNHNVSLKGHLKSHHTEKESTKKRGRRRAGARANGSEAGDGDKPDAAENQDTGNDVQMEETVKTMVKGRPKGRPKRKGAGSSVQTEKKQRRGSKTKNDKSKSEEIIEDDVN